MNVNRTSFSELFLPDEFLPGLNNTDLEVPSFCPCVEPVANPAIDQEPRRPVLKNFTDDEIKKIFLGKVVGASCKDIANQLERKTPVQVTRCWKIMKEQDPDLANKVLQARKEQGIELHERCKLRRKRTTFTADEESKIIEKKIRRLPFIKVVDWFQGKTLKQINDHWQVMKRRDPDLKNRIVREQKEQVSLQHDLEQAVKVPEMKPQTAIAIPQLVSQDPVLQQVFKLYYAGCTLNQIATEMAASIEWVKAQIKNF